MKTEPRHPCPSCGNEFSGAMEFCPVCMLRMGLAGRVEFGDSSAVEDTVKVTSEQARQRFEHYELVKSPDGTPVELGRGAMGITYKAVDVDLHCPVTLKVISEKYLSDESARLRFLREARAAASVRHPNVASVFHLGRTGQNHFYAMEFVEGETLENLIERSGRLEVKLALEIATQAAAGLAAVHKQKLVHRDIKPSNIMVSFEEGSSVTAKIIDLGLAKAVNEPGFQSAVSIPGSFAGTPAFASPEQFAGVGVDIRSDLYSLGVTLWKMVTGLALFKGSSAEVMYQHQHEPLPLDQLKGVPQPVIVLLEALLEKDPARRFQNPLDLLRAMTAITCAIDARRAITRQGLQKVPPADPSGVIRRSAARRGPKKISIARLPITGSEVFGRGEDLTFLDAAWTITPAIACLCFEALAEWHLGELASCQTTMAEAIAVAKELNDMQALVLTLHYNGVLGHFECKPAVVERCASDLLELSTRLNFATWLPGGAILRGWARSASGDTAEGIAWMEDGIRDSRASGTVLALPYYLGLKAEALHLADRTSEALEAIEEAEKVVERSAERQWCAELHRLRGVFLTAIGADEAHIEASFCAAIRTAKEQKSVSLAKRAETSYTEYIHQKASRSGGRGFRLPLW
jgi:hypothetical protein